MSYRYRCKYFEIQELVPPHVYDERGDRAWELFDEGLLRSLDGLRERFGRLVINNWHTGGNRKWSGLRTEDSPYGTQFSQHRFGRAADIIPLDTDVETIRSWILSQPTPPFYITTVELGTSWLHIDVRNAYDANHPSGLKTFYP